MTRQNPHALDQDLPPTDIDIGTPVEWMVDPNERRTILGVTYVFSQTGLRRTVWYTPNKRPRKGAVVITDLSG